jgi:chloramphenicol 3-O-phosphotransferase
MAEPPFGRVVVLNGPSSAGKTTLAQAVRDALAPRAACVSIDQLYPCISTEHPNDWRQVRALTDATFAAAAALARGGFDVVVDTVFDRIDCVDIAKAALADFPRHFVAVTCPLDLLERREQARRDRPIGLARSQIDRVFHDVSYDLKLDTSVLTVEQSVDHVMTLLREDIARK